MTRHIVVTLHGMAKRSVVVPSFRYDFVESYFQISSHVGIGILVQSQACRRMLDEYIHHTDVNGREFLSDDRFDIGRNEMTSPRRSRDGN